MQLLLYKEWIDIWWIWSHSPNDTIISDHIIRLLMYRAFIFSLLWWKIWYRSRNVETLISSLDQIKAPSSLPQSEKNKWFCFFVCFCFNQSRKWRSKRSQFLSPSAVEITACKIVCYQNVLMSLLLINSSKYLSNYCFNVFNCNKIILHRPSLRTIYR